MTAKIFNNHDGKGDKPYLLWIAKHHDGYVLSANRSEKPAHRTIHKAKCSTIRVVGRNEHSDPFTGRGFVKVCADHPLDLLNWIQARGLNGFSNQCGRCNPNIPGDHRPFDSLPPTEANDGFFDPKNIVDARETICLQIKARRGQQKFRDSLLEAYDRQCAITGCAVLDVLEAAHIYPYRGNGTNHVANGLLLRADIHTLFDCGMVAIDPSDLRLVVAPSVDDSTYRKLDGRLLRPRKEGWPGASEEALRLKFMEFLDRHKA